MSLTVPEAIESRRAVRKYTDQPVTADVLDRVAHLALEAPTAFNAQRADLVVVRDQKVKDAIFAASGQKQHRDAPVVLVTVARAGMPTLSDLEQVMPKERAEYVFNYLSKSNKETLRETALKDAMLISGFALLAAESEGLATSPTTGWDEAKVLDAIGLGGHGDYAIGLVIAMGYPDESPEHPGRAADRRVDDHY